MATRIATSPVIWIGVVVGVLVGAAEYAGGSEPEPALLGGAIPMAYGLVVTLLGRRSAMSSVLAGRPIDERWEHISLEAVAWAFGATAVVVLGVFLVALTSGGEWQPYAFVGAAMALAYLVSLVVVQARH